VKSKTSGLNCRRCRGFAEAPNDSLIKCTCTDAQLEPFTFESDQDQMIVTKMLFLLRLTNEGSVPLGQRQGYLRDLMRLYRDNEQLSIRNGVPSPFITTGT
jgi:hypothetical protein